MSVSIQQSPGGLPSVTYDSGTANGELSQDIWREVCQPAFETKSLVAVKDFRTAFSFQPVNGLCFCETSYEACQFERTGRRVGNGEMDNLAIHLLLKGEEKIRTNDGYEREITPTGVFIHDWSKPYVGRATATHQLSVSIPRHLVPGCEILRAGDPTHEWGLSTPGGKMLSHSLHTLFDGLPVFTPMEANSAASGFLGLLNSLLDTDLNGRKTPVSSATPAMKGFLKKHLSHPGLGVDDLVRNFHFSRATIYRAFQDVGGVKSFIREERLEACRHSFLKGGGGSRETAEKWGFTDVSHFHRLFRTKFGVTPGECMASSQLEPAGEVATTPRNRLGIRQIHRWMNADAEGT